MPWYGLRERTPRDLDVIDAGFLAKYHPIRGDATTIWVLAGIVRGSGSPGSDMTESEQGEPAAITGRRPSRIILASVSTVLGLAAAILIFRPTWFDSMIGRNASSAGRTFAFDSPYRNSRPDVGYVGEATCSRCHAEIAESYRRHPMGRSLDPPVPL